MLQPERLRDPGFLCGTDPLEPVRGGRLPDASRDGLEHAPLGTMNLHASLLPDYRGAAPINWAVIDGEQRTGVTTFFIAATIDTGDIIARENAPSVRTETPVNCTTVEGTGRRPVGALRSRSAGWTRTGRHRTPWPGPARSIMHRSSPRRTPASIGNCRRSGY